MHAHTPDTALFTVYILRVARLTNEEEFDQIGSYTEIRLQPSLMCQTPKHSFNAPSVHGGTYRIPTRLSMEPPYDHSGSCSHEPLSYERRSLLAREDRPSSYPKSCKQKGFYFRRAERETFQFFANWRRTCPHRVTEARVCSRVREPNTLQPPTVPPFTVYSVVTCGLTCVCMTPSRSHSVICRLYWVTFTQVSCDCVVCNLEVVHLANTGAEAHVYSGALRVGRPCVVLSLVSS